MKNINSSPEKARGDDAWEFFRAQVRMIFSCQDKTFGKISRKKCNFFPAVFSFYRAKSKRFFFTLTFFFFFFQTYSYDTYYKFYLFAIFEVYLTQNPFCFNLSHFMMWKIFAPPFKLKKKSVNNFVFDK